jgi:hypothetical protein
MGGGRRVKNLLLTLYYVLKMKLVLDMSLEGLKPFLQPFYFTQ